MRLSSPKAIIRFAKNRFITHKPFVLNHFITLKCNLKCKTCFFTNEKIREMDISSTYNMLRKAKDAGFFIYMVTGGEPLLVKELPSIINYAKSLGFMTYMTTNGILLKQRAREITNIDYVSISIDGSEKMHDKIRGTGSYKKSINGIREAKKLGIKTRIIFTIGKDNENELNNLVGLAESMGVSLVVNARSFDGKTELELPVEYGKCRFPNIYLPILPDGDIFYPCMGTNLGSVKNICLKDFLNSKKFKDFLIKASNCNKKCNFSCVKDGSLIYNLNIKKIIGFLKNDFSY